jgi:hypothetical protein
MKEGKIVKNFLIAGAIICGCIFALLIVLSWIGKYPELLDARIKKQHQALIYINQPHCKDESVRNQLDEYQELCRKAKYTSVASPHYLALVDVSNELCSHNTICKDIMSGILYNIYGSILGAIFVVSLLLYFGVIKITQHNHNAKMKAFALPTSMNCHNKFD